MRPYCSIWMVSTPRAAPWQQFPIYISTAHTNTHLARLGTLIDSTTAIISYWTRFGLAHNISPQLILSTSPGVRSIDVVSLYAPELANWTYISRVEGEIPYRADSNAVHVPGALKLVSEIEKLAGPKGWAIVTSGTRGLAEGWLETMKFPVPKVFVTAERVGRGKPDPEGKLPPQNNQFSGG